jgi:hypothetical protein
VADKQATFALRIDSNAAQAGAEGAAGLRTYQAAITASQAAIKDYQTTLRALRGSSDEVRGAKDQLKAKIDAERSAVSTATLEIIKQGTSLQKLTEAEKKAGAAANDNAKSTGNWLSQVKAAGGPLGEVAGKVEDLTGKLGTGAGSFALIAGAAVAAVAAIVEATRAVFDLTASFVRWIVVSADANRSAMIQREAWTGSASSAKALGNQIDALTGKVPIARDKLAEMSGQLVKALNNSRVSGQGIVDTFNAVAQASSAMGDEVGAKLREIVERAKNTGRVQIGLFELQGTGISRENVAAQLAKTMHVGTQAALAALAQGRVKVNDAAAAIRAAVEERFGQINARKLLSLDAQLQRFHDNLAKLTSGVNLEPLLAGFAKLGELLDPSKTVAAASLKKLITIVGNEIGPAFQAAIPIAASFFKHVEIGGLKIAIALFSAKKQIKDALGDIGKNFDLGGASAKYFEHTVAGVVKPILDGIRFMAHGIALAITAWRTLTVIVNKAKETFNDFKDAGYNVVTGIIEGINGALADIKGAMNKLADNIKDAFKNALGIHSPSSVFEGYGKQTAAGYQQGVDKGSQSTQRAVEKMAPDRPANDNAGKAGAQGSGARAAPVNVVVNLHVGSESAAKQLQQPRFLADLTKTLTDALVAAGLPVQQEPTT